MNIENQNQINQTFGEVVGGKIIAHIRDRKAKHLLKEIAELIIGLFLGAAIIAPQKVIVTLINIFSYNGFVIMKVIVTLAIFFYRKSIIRLFKKVRKFHMKHQIVETDKLIDGIPVHELADYLIRNNNFKREGINGVRETFGISSMEKFNRLANNLEYKKILKRGENNMRVLDGRWSRQALIDFLSQSKDSGDGENWFRVFKINAPQAKLRFDKKEILSNSI